MNKNVKQLIQIAIFLLLAIGAPFMILNAGCAYGSDNDSKGKIAEKISELKQQNLFKSESHVFSLARITTDAEISKVVAKYTLIDLNANERSSIINTKPNYLKLSIPVDNGARSFTILLYKVDISPNGFTLLTSDGLVHAVDNIIHYRGSIENDNHSVVCLSFTNNEIMGLICNNEGNFVLGKIKGNPDGKHIIYNDKNLIPKSNFVCETNTIVPQNNAYRYDSTGSNNTLSVKCVNFYWETDYDVYASMGSVASVNNYVQGIFNQVSTLYANDGMSINLGTVYIWNTVDPFTGPAVSNYLTQFGSYRTSFSGDLATLIGFSGNGGQAFLGSLCYNPTLPQYAMAYCGVNSSYNIVPVYSWTVENITHENGHNIGSRHTHDCVWNGNNTVIDACGQTAGYAGVGCNPNPTTPIPNATGGTIMSYCHLTSAGINLNNGFGPQPAALMLNNINAAACLSLCGGCIPPLQPSLISGNTSVCQGTSQTYFIPTVTGATSYTWTLPTGWTGTSSTNSITAITGSASGTILVTANNSCGSSSPRTLAVTVSLIPAQPGTITGSASVCQSSSQTYSVTSVSGATSYTWTLPTGWTGTSTTNSITVTTGSAGGTISVTANNSCGSSAVRTLGVTISAAPAQPGTITGSPSVCQSSSQTYSVTSVSGATSYTWTKPSGWTGTSTTNSITVTAGSAGGTISVTANNSCGSSAARTLAVTVTPIPSQPGAISGATPACQSSSQTYSVASVTGATSYTWTLPTGWTGTSTTNSITVTAGSTGGTISVRANNSCGSSALRTKTVSTISVPSQPGTITGTASVCTGVSQTYSVATVTGATSYTWTLPSGWAGTSISNSITVTTGTQGGIISVAANNACGIGTARTLTLTISGTAPEQPGTISGSASVCQSSSQTYSITSVSGATSYTWTKPSGWTGTSTTNSIAVTVGSAGGTISVKANNSCGTSAARTLAVTITPVPSQPGTISGATSVCQSSSQTYSIASVTGATSYIWTLPIGWTGTSTTNSITVTAGSTGGTISVRANNSCGSSAARTLAVTVTPVPSQPGIISGPTSVCQSSSQTYSIASVTGATSYTWTLPTGWTGTSTTNSITVTTGNADGSISAIANNVCGGGSPRTLAVTVTPVPSQPGAISGVISVCESSSQTYSVASVTGATNYTWTLPMGWIGTSTTNSITVTAGSASGNISVSANNSCGSSGVQTIALDVSNVPAPFDSIYRSGGRFKVCPGDSRIYSVVLISGIAYNWTVPEGASITSGQGTNIINVTYDNNFIDNGTLAVSASNSCGAGPSINTLIKRKIPAVPASISGPVSVCNGSVRIYSIAAVPSALSYLWTVPADASIQGSQTGRQISVRWGASGGIITVKAHNNCADSGPQLLAVNVTCRLVGAENDNEIKADLFPNPTTGMLTVKFFTAYELSYSIIVTDIAGRILKSEKQKSVSGDNMSMLDLSGFSKGIYFVRIESTEMNQLIKVSVE